MPQKLEKESFYYNKITINKTNFWFFNTKKED